MDSDTLKRMARREELRAMSQQQLRRYVIDSGYDITYLGRKPMSEIINLVMESDIKHGRLPG